LRFIRHERRMKLFDLAGRAALVTGGTRGIGFGMARGLAEAGARVAIAARNAERADPALAELRALNPECYFLPADVSDAAQCRALIQAAIARLGRLDILVNNAGTNIRKPPQDYSDEEWRAIIDLNLTGAFVCAQAAYPAMAQAGGGKIINVGSVMSLFGAPWSGPYAASKGGIAQLTKALATAWAKDNIQVNCVLPGSIDTELARDANRAVPGLFERAIARTPAARLGKDGDFSGVAVFLASRASDFITGALIPVDGGYTALG
jgi:2-deoxy-D-gluconate 3-dehydrogenase